eukprot:COSAG02_NODE_7771_length_2854_cov_7.933575_5_plen_63_part_00
MILRRSLLHLLSNPADDGTGDEPGMWRGRNVDWGGQRDRNAISQWDFLTHTKRRKLDGKVDC